MTIGGVQLDDRIAGALEYEATMGNCAADGLRPLAVAMPEMYDALLAIFGVTVARPELPRAEREMVTVAMLAALGEDAQHLTHHAEAALRHGAHPDELRALCRHVLVAAGLPRAMNALGIVNQLFAEQGVPPPAAQQRVVVGDHDTVVAHAGDSGPAVVLVYSAGTDWRMWEPVMTRLASNHRVFAFDVRGHGVSAGAAPPISVQQLGDDLITVLNELELPAAHLVGHAFGGAIALQGALDNPNLCESLVLLASVDRPSQGSGSQLIDASVGGVDARIAHTLPRWFTPHDLAHNSWGVRYARERIRRHQQPQWEAAWKLWEHFDVRARLGKLLKPVLLVAGEHDSVVSPRAVAAMAEHIPQATYRLLPGATHHQTFNCANAVTSAMEHFYDALYTRA